MSNHLSDLPLLILCFLLAVETTVEGINPTKKPEFLKNSEFLSPPGKRKSAYVLCPK